MPKHFVRAAEAASIRAESSKRVDVEGHDLLVCHSKGAFFAVANKCSHADEKLDCGRVRNGWVSCPIHGARFALETGEAMNPPATQPIATYPCREVDGWIEVEIDG